MKSNYPRNSICYNCQKNMVSEVNVVSTLMDPNVKLDKYNKSVDPIQ